MPGTKARLQPPERGETPHADGDFLSPDTGLNTRSKQASKWQQINPILSCSTD